MCIYLNLLLYDLLPNSSFQPVTGDCELLDFVHWCHRESGGPPHLAALPTLNRSDAFNSISHSAPGAGMCGMSARSIDDALGWHVAISELIESAYLSPHRVKCRPQVNIICDLHLDHICSPACMHACIWAIPFF